ncbi:MAG: glycosyltransferase family 9 protein [Verrucomicrobiales bacterium]
MRILCLQLKRIGDAILTAPALAALREAHPLANMTLVLHGVSGQLGPAFAAVDEVCIYKPGRPNVKLWSRVVAGRWQACFDFTGTDRSALMARMSRASRIFGYRKFAERRPWRPHCYTELRDVAVRDLHTVDFFRSLTGLPPAEDSGFEVPSRKKTRGDVLPRGDYVVVHPGSARVEKLWPAERWAEVIAHIKAPVVLTGSDDSDEQKHIEQILSKVPAKSKVRNLSGRLTLLQLASVIGHARVLLSVDSAAMHLAAMEERPQVALFGPTNPFHWRPRHAQARVLMGGVTPAEFSPHDEPRSMNELPAAAVIEAVDSLLAASAPKQKLR